jgi:carbamoyltransferase
MVGRSSRSAKHSEGTGSNPRPGEPLVVAINDPVHDSAYAVAEGSAIRHVEVERLTRRKYENLDPLVALCFLEPDLLARATILLVEEGRTYAPFLRAAAAGEAPDAEGLAAQVMRKNQTRLPAGVDPAAVGQDLLAVLRRLASGELPFRLYNHHFCHAVNAFLSSPFEQALSVTLDGGGLHFLDGRQVSVHGSAYAFSRSDAEDRPLGLVTDWSPGWAWDRACRAVGMTENEAGTVMAMAAYGKGHALIDAIVRTETFWCIGFDGWPRARRQRLRAYHRALEYFARHERGRFSLGFVLQRETEWRIRRYLAGILGGRGEVDLCLAGGTFLNCIAAHKVREWFPQVREVFVPPVPYDAGLCIGMVQRFLHSHGTPERIDGPLHPFASPPVFTEQQILAACAEAGLAAQPGVGVEIVAELLAAGDIVAHFQGGSESGRRALGNRSILCDPRRADNRERLNHTIKRRQWYRPFAPMVLAEHAADWFVLPERFSSPYMSFAAKFRPGMGDKVPAVRHADDTARLQTIHRELTPRTHALIEAWFAKTGVPILLNTSFNDNEPIVETPQEAIATFVRSGIDALYFADFGLLLTHAAKGRRAREPAATEPALRR